MHRGDPSSPSVQERNARGQQRELLKAEAETGTQRHESLAPSISLTPDMGVEKQRLGQPKEHPSGSRSPC